MKVLWITPEETYPLRHKILRPNQTIEDCQYPADTEYNTFHLGVFVGDQLISVASFYNENLPDMKSNHQYRLRGMATDPDFRLQRAGTRIIEKAQTIIQNRQADLLWCNARITVSDYYKKLGFYEVGEVFDIYPIGPHQVMAKIL